MGSGLSETITQLVFDLLMGAVVAFTFNSCDGCMVFWGERT